MTLEFLVIKNIKKTFDFQYDIIIECLNFNYFNTTTVLSHIFNIHVKCNICNIKHSFISIFTKKKKKMGCLHMNCR